MPQALLEKLPARAREIYEEAYESALETYDGDETKAAKVAVTAVKNAGYEKDEETGNWKKKMQVVEMYFTKASLDPETGERRWAATVSKFEEDNEGDEITPEFFKSAIAAMESGKRPSPILCISHIDRGKPSDSWAAGDTSALYVDGDRPKAKGTFRDTVLGRAAFSAVETDIKDDVPREERTRISMGFFDEGSVAKAEGPGRKYLQGWVKHLAMTRAPVVRETEFDEVVQKGEGGMKTVREDAESIVGKDLADELLKERKREKGLIQKGREDQIRVLVKQLLSLLGEEADVTTLGTAQRAATGNRGTNPPRAQEADYKGEVDGLVDAFAVHVKSTLLGAGDRTAKFTAIQKGLDRFGEGVTGLVKGYTPPSAQDISEVVQTAVQVAVQPLQQEVIRLQAELEGLKNRPVSTIEASPRPASMDTRVKMEAPRPRQAKARTAAEIAWETTREQPRY